MKAVTTVFLALLAIAALTTAATAQDRERYVRFTINDKAELHDITRMISIARVDHDTVLAYANEKEWATLRASGYDAVDLPYPDLEVDHTMSNTPAGLMEWDAYPTYQAYLAMMNQYAATYPSLCMLDTIGFSVQGRLILALKISKHVTVREDEPQVLYTSTMHGNETTGFIMLLRLADYLLTQYGQPTAEGERVRNLVDNTEIWLNPLFNPDGTYRKGADTTVNKATRGNAHGVDLNRNFPDRVSDSNNTTTGREAETQAMMRWTSKHSITLSANFHGGAQVVNYPWDNGVTSGQYSKCPDDAWFVHLSRAYATPNPDIMNGGFANGITNGCEWYEIFGGRQDWMYVWNGGRETTIELTNTSNPPGSYLPQRWTNNKESFLAYLEQALKGIRGVVTDAVTHAPLKARIDVAGVPNVPVFTDSTVGDFHRLLLPGTYSIIVQAPGYGSDTVQNVVINDSLATRVDVALLSTVPVTEGPSGLLHQFVLSQNYPNPFNPTTVVRYQLPEVSEVELVVYDLLGREVAVLVNEREAPGGHAVQFDGSRFSSGVYIYTLRAHLLSEGQARHTDGGQAGDFVQTKRLVLLK